MPRFEVVRGRRVVEADFHKLVEGQGGEALLPHCPLPGVKRMGLVQKRGVLRLRCELDELDHRDAVPRADVRRPFGTSEGFEDGSEVSHAP